MGRRPQNHIFAVLLAFAVILSTLFFPPEKSIAASKPLSIKIATIAPEGSVWDRVLREFNDDLQKQTDNRVRFKIYPGGVAGDEKGVLSKMRIGQMDGGAFTGFGMGEILPEVRILDLPFFFRNEREFEAVRAGLSDHYHKAFSDKGYELIGWLYLGSAYFYSTKPINTLNELRKTKAWVWEGDTLAFTCLQEIGIAPIPLSVVDVMMGLQTGIVDTVYNTPLGAVSFQWFTKTKYQSSTPMAFLTATLLVKNKIYEKISPQDQQTLKALSEKYFQKLNGLVKEQNSESIHVMATRGVKQVVWPNEDIDILKTASDSVYEKLIGQQYPKELYERAVQLRENIKSTSMLADETDNIQ